MFQNPLQHTRVGKDILLNNWSKYNRRNNPQAGWPKLNDISLCWVLTFRVLSLEIHHVLSCSTNLVFSFLQLHCIQPHTCWSSPQPVFSGGCGEGNVQSVWHTPVLPHPSPMSRVWKGFVSLACLPQSLAEIPPDWAPCWSLHPQHCRRIMVPESWKKEM